MSATKTKPTKRRAAPKPLAIVKSEVQTTPPPDENSHTKKYAFDAYEECARQFQEQHPEIEIKACPLYYFGAYCDNSFVQYAGWIAPARGFAAACFSVTAMDISNYQVVVLLPLWDTVPADLRAISVGDFVTVRDGRIVKSETSGS